MSESTPPALSQKELTLNNIQELRAELARCIARQNEYGNYITLSNRIAMTESIIHALEAEMKFYKTLTTKSCKHRRHKKSPN